MQLFVKHTLRYRAFMHNYFEERRQDTEYRKQEASAVFFEINTNSPIFCLLYPVFFLRGLFMSFFQSIEMLPADPILSLPILFNADPRSQKVNLGIGAYRNGEGQPIILSCVKKAEAFVLEKQRNKEYLPVEGDPTFIAETIKLIYGDQSPLIKSEEVFCAQTIGGSGALRIGAEFLATSGISNGKIYLPQPTWPNHRLIFKKAGLHFESYSYYDSVKHDLDFSGMCAAIRKMPERSIILLHGCCQNPTGIDPTADQWQEICQLIKKQNVIPFIDLAYQGFGQDLEADAAAVRLFVLQGVECFVSNSYAKNLGLYGERVGSLSIVTFQKELSKKVGSQIKQIIRGNYSTPPLHGARIVTTILQSPSLKAEWHQELGMMRERIINMRKSLVAGLVSQKKGKDFSLLKDQKGIFSYSGLNPEQVSQLQKEYGIYMASDGRINVAGLNQHNLEYVVNAILAVS